MGPTLDLCAALSPSDIPRCSHFPALFCKIHHHSLTMPCSAPAVIFPIIPSTSMPPRHGEHPKDIWSGSHLCYIGKLFLCVFLCVQIPGNKGRGSLGCAGDRSKGKRGEEGRRDDASFHPAAPCTTIPAQTENMFQTHLSHECNEAKIGDFSMCWILAFVQWGIFHL